MIIISVEMAQNDLITLFYWLTYYESRSLLLCFCDKPQHISQLCSLPACEIWWRTDYSYERVM